MTETIAGVDIPDSKLAAEATEFIRTQTPELVFNHSRRVFLFGTLQGRAMGVVPDPELLYVAAMFHDVGLVNPHRNLEQRFELDGADAARAFLLSHGISEIDALKSWTAIALHTTPEVPYRMGPEIALTTAGVESDVLGLHLERLTEDDIHAVTTVHPRPDFKNRILQAFNDGFADRPDSTFGTVNADVLVHFDPTFKPINFVEVILNSSWPE